MQARARQHLGDLDLAHGRAARFQMAHELPDEVREAIHRRAHADERPRSRLVDAPKPARDRDRRNEKALGELSRRPARLRLDGEDLESLLGAVVGTLLRRQCGRNAHEAEHFPARRARRASRMPRAGPARRTRSMGLFSHHARTKIMPRCASAMAHRNAALTWSGQLRGSGIAGGGCDDMESSIVERELGRNLAARRAQCSGSRSARQLRRAKRSVASPCSLRRVTRGAHAQAAKGASRTKSTCAAAEHA